MSSKRVLKKLQKREAAALARLEDLYLRGADDEFLACAAEQAGDLAASPLASAWAEVADRACVHGLARADFPRLERLLRSLGGRKSRPLAILAEAVLDLGAGRLEAARPRLAALSGPSTTAPATVPRDLVAGLQSLAGTADAPPGTLLGDPRLQAAAGLVRALRGLEAGGFAPTAADRKTLARSLQAVRMTASADDGELRRFLDSADRCLALLAGLAKLETQLDGSPKGRSQASAAVAGWLRSPGPQLAAALAAAGPPLAAPLQHAVRSRWRGVLERVSTREGSPELAALVAADPKLLAHDVDLPGGQAAFRQHLQARQLLATQRYAELAEMLRSSSRAAADGGTLAAFWSLELWARQRQAQHETGDDDDPFPAFAEATPHRALVRLQEMAGEIGRRFPAEHRAEVARALADELFEICEEISFCEHTAGAALALLENRPGNVCELGLLIAGLAGAISSAPPRTRRAFDAHLARQDNVGAGEQLALAKRLLAEVAREELPVVAQVLDAVKPVFSAGAWPEIAALVAQGMGEGFVELLLEAGWEREDLEMSGFDLGEIRGELNRLRPALAGTPGFTAMELALDCWRPDRAPVVQRIASFLAAHPDLESALVAFEFLHHAAKAWAPPTLDAALRSLGHAVIDRLDHRWRRWWRDVPMLAVAADRDDVRLLEQIVRKLLSSPAVRAESRGALDEALHAIQHIERLKRDLGRPPRRRQRRQPARARSEPVFDGALPDLADPETQPRRKRPRRRLSGTPQLRLDFE